LRESDSVVNCPRISRILLGLAGIAIVVVSVALCFAVQPAYATSRVLPVLLVHGYDAWGDSKSDWVRGGWIASDLREVGHGQGWTVYASATPTSAQDRSSGIFGAAPVYSLDYHGYYCAKGHLRPSAGLLSKAIDVVIADSGATDVYIIALSQGGLMTRAVLEGLAVAPDDDSPIPYKNDIFGFMTIDTPHKGSSTTWLMRFLSDASKDMVSGSNFLQDLNATPTFIDTSTFCSVAVGNAMGEAKGDGLFSVDEQTPVVGTVPTSTEVRTFPVVHGRGMLGVDYSRYTAAQDSPQVRGWARVRYLQALRQYQEFNRSPSTAAGTVRAIDRAGSLTALIAVYIVSGLTWGLAYWFGLRSGRAGVSRRAAWPRSLGMCLLLVIGSGVWDVTAILVSSLALPCCYLLGWNRMIRSHHAANAKNDQPATAAVQHSLPTDNTPPAR
jgi:hypothetical protein